MTMDERIKMMLQAFIDEMKNPDNYYSSISSGDYRWGIIYEKQTNNIMFTFRGRTYSDLLENIKYAYAAHRFVSIN